MLKIVRRRAAQLAECLISSAAVFFLAASVVATVAAEDRDKLLTAEPLARCALDTVKDNRPTGMMDANQFVSQYRTAAEGALASYDRAAGGQWHIPANVDRQDPWLRLLVFAPGAPQLVDVAIYFDGEPYSAAREKLIDGLLDHATVESLVREAVEVPVPDDVPELSLDQPSEESGKESSDVEVVPPAEEEKAASAEGESTESQSASIESNEESDGTSESPAEEVAAADANDEPEASEESQEEELAEPEVALVEVQRRQARTVAQRLVNYMASAEVEADREEVRWLMAEWTGGPALLTLGPAASWQRSSVSPLWQVLDRDQDDSLSATEIAAAPERLKQSDINENGIIVLQELFEAAPQRRAVLRAYPLLVVLSPETDWRQLGQSLIEAYGRSGTAENGDHSSSASMIVREFLQGMNQRSTRNLQALLEAPADFTLSIRFDGDNAGVALHRAEGSSGSDLHSAEKTLGYLRQANYFEFSAAKIKSDDPSVPAQTQLSVGAVEDGYPLFRLLDTNGDRRISSREQRLLAPLLTKLDLDQDGLISLAEKPSTIRIAFTRGPHVHEHLAEPTSSSYLELEQAEGGEGAQAAPSWFTDMDRNSDGDVSRGEFLGNTEQFSSMDRDGDGLLSKEEAAAAGQ